MRRLMQTTIALPSSASSRSSKWSTRSRGDQLDAASRCRPSPRARPLALELLLALDLLALGDLLELGVERRASRSSGSVELGQAALVVDGHRGAVLDRALDVVDVDVVAEDGAGVLVGQLDRRAGEADERGVRQRVAQVPGEAVDEVVLAAVRLVGDDDDVARGRESSGCASPFSSGRNFWMVVKTTPPEATCEHARAGRSRLSACTGVWRSSSLAAREGAEELVVQVVAVGEDDERRVLHRRLLDELAGVEGHREALAAALRVPDDADAAVALGDGARRSPRPPC